MARSILLSLVAVALIGLASPSPAPAQAKRTMEGKGNAAWATVVEEFARALAKGDLSVVDRLVAPKATVRRFDGAGNDEVWTVFERTMNATLVGEHGYVHPPRSMAGDLAVDFTKASGVPEAGKARFLIDDEGDLRRANATAVQWLETQIDAKNGMLVGAVVMWTPAGEPVFVLVKGEEGAGGAVRIRTILYGVPVESRQ
jgi:hypothetical protein